MITIRVDSARTQAALAELGPAAADGRVPLRQFYQGFRAKVGVAWGQQRPEGGSFRGKQWPKVADQYTRKTDGVTVPVYGGVPRVAKGFRKAGKWSGDTQRRGVSTGQRMRGVSGNVSGKLRPSGKRWTRSSTVMRDTGDLYNWAFPARPDITRQRLRLGGDVPDWRAKQIREHGTRPLMFFIPEDERDLGLVSEGYLAQLASKFNRS